MKYTDEQLAQIEAYGRLSIDLALIAGLLSGKESAAYVRGLLNDIKTEGSDANKAYARGLAQRQVELEESLLKLGLGDAADRKAYDEAMLNRKLDDIIKENFGIE